jgi:putative hemolysin
VYDNGQPAYRRRHRRIRAVKKDTVTGGHETGKTVSVSCASLSLLPLRYRHSTSPPYQTSKEIETTQEHCHNRIAYWDVSGCASPAITQPDVAQPTATQPESTQPAIANPAAELRDQGGTLSSGNAVTAGSFSLLLEDNLQCEERALMRGDCSAGGLKVTGISPAAGTRHHRWNLRARQQWRRQRTGHLQLKMACSVTPGIITTGRVSLALRRQPLLIDYSAVTGSL